AIYPLARVQANVSISFAAERAGRFDGSVSTHRAAARTQIGHLETIRTTRRNGSEAAESQAARIQARYKEWRASAFAERDDGGNECHASRASASNDGARNETRTRRAIHGLYHARGLCQHSRSDGARLAAEWV